MGSLSVVVKYRARYVSLLLSEEIDKYYNIIIVLLYTSKFIFL